MKGSRLALPHGHQRKFAMELVAALAATFDERAGKRAQPANDPAAEIELGAACHLPLRIGAEWR